MKLKVGVFLGLILILSTYTGSASAEFDKKSCIAKIPKDAGVAVTNKMRKDCENKERKIAENEHIEKDKANRNSPYKSPDLNTSLGTDLCAQNYSEYKKIGQKAFKEKMIKNLVEKDLNFGIEHEWYKDNLTEKEKKALSKKIRDSPYFQDNVDHIDQCIRLYKSVGDPNISKNHLKIREFLINEALEGMAPSTKVGNVKTPDLEELEKRINKKLEKLEKENKQLKEQVKNKK